MKLTLTATTSVGSTVLLEAQGLRHVGVTDVANALNSLTGTYELRFLDATTRDILADDLTDLARLLKPPAFPLSVPRFVVRGPASAALVNACATVYPVFGLDIEGGAGLDCLAPATWAKCVELHVRGDALAIKALARVKALMCLHTSGIFGALDQFMPASVQRSLLAASDDNEHDRTVADLTVVFNGALPAWTMLLIAVGAYTEYVDRVPRGLLPSLAADGLVARKVARRMVAANTPAALPVQWETADLGLALVNSLAGTNLPQHILQTIGAYTLIQEVV